MEAMRIVIDIFIGISVFFAFAGVVGMLRMPDAFCRMQSSTNISTLGVLGVIMTTGLQLFGQTLGTPVGEGEAGAGKSHQRFLVMLLMSLKVEVMLLPRMQGSDLVDCIFYL